MASQRFGRWALPTLVALLAAAVVVAFVAMRARHDAESSLEQERTEFTAAQQAHDQELDAANERAAGLEEDIAQTADRADRNGSRWIAALAVSGQLSPVESRLLALDAIRRSPTVQARAALGHTLFVDPRVSPPILEVAHDGPVWGVAISPDGELVASASGDGTIGVWETSTGTQRAVLDHDEAVWTVAFSPAGTEVLSASSDGSARVWSIDTGEVLHRIDHDDRVNEAWFSPDGAAVVTASHDGLAKVWDFQSGTNVLDMEHSDIVWGAAFSTDGQRVATVGGDGVTRLFELPEGNVIAEIDHGRVTEVLSFSPNGQLLFAGGQGQMHFADARTGDILFSPTEGGGGGVLAIDWHPDGSEATIASLGSGLTRFDLTTGEALANYRQVGGVRAVKYAPNGEWLAGASGDFQFSFGEISFWDLDTHERLVRLNLGGPVETLTVDASSSTLVAGYRATEDLIERGAAWIVPAERRWTDLACESAAGKQISESNWAEIVGPDEPFIRVCP